jgi:hypothetical protein
MPQNAPSFAELLDGARYTAVHLEMRDAYGVSDEAEDFALWKATGERDADPGSRYWAPWVDLIRGAVERGVCIRRARIVSEPVSDYIRYEHAGTPVNLSAGEQVRWLARRRVSDVPLPGNDFWLIDSALVRWNHFSGEGASCGGEMSDDPAAAGLCSRAFEAVWARAVPHEEFKIT